MQGVLLTSASQVLRWRQIGDELTDNKQLRQCRTKEFDMDGTTGVTAEMIANHDKQLAIIAQSDKEKRDLSDKEATELEELQERYSHLEKCNRLRAKAESVEDKLTAPKGPPFPFLYPRDMGNGMIGPDTEVLDIRAMRRGEGGNSYDTSAQHLQANGWRYRPYGRAIDRQELNSGGFRDFGEFIHAVASASKGIADSRLKRLASMGEGTGVGGGFAVPMLYSAQLFATAELLAPYLALRTNVDVLAGPSINFPTINDRDESSKEVAGFAMARAAESSALAEDTVVLGSTQLNLKKAAKIVRVSNELLADSLVGTMDRIREVFAKSLTLLQIDNLVNGTGSGEPMGLIGAAATYEVATSTATTKIDLLDVLNMTARLEPGDDARTVWLAHPSVIPALGTMVSAASTSIEPTWTSSARDASPRSLLGYPLHMCSACQQLDTPGDLILARLDRYVYAATPLRIDTDTSYKFGNDEVTFRITIRDDGSPIDSTTFTDASGYTQAPFVTLAART